MGGNNDRSFEELRESVLALGGPFMPEAVADKSGLLGYAVFSVTALRAASEAYERDLVDGELRDTYQPPSDEAVAYTLSTQCRHFAGQMTQSLWADSEQMRRETEAADPPPPIEERVGRAVAARDTRNLTFTGLALLRLLTVFDLPASTLGNITDQLPDWARGRREPTIGEVFAGALEFGDAGLLKKLIARLKAESRTAPKERDWRHLAHLYEALRDQVRAARRDECPISEELAKRLESADLRVDSPMAPAKLAIALVAKEYGVSVGTLERKLKALRRESRVQAS